MSFIKYKIIRCIKSNKTLNKIYLYNSIIYYFYFYVANDFYVWHTKRFYDQTINQHDISNRKSTIDVIHYTSQNKTKFIKIIDQ